VRVLYINPFSQEISGPDESLRTLLGALMPMGVEAHVAIPQPGPQVERYQALGVTVHYAPVAVIRRRLGPARLARLPATFVGGVKRLVEIGRRIRADLVHSNMEVILEGAVAARLLRLPHVMHYRGNTLDEPKWIFDALTTMWNAGADHIFCISHGTAGVFERRHKASKVEVMYNPVDIQAFAATPRSEDVRSALGAAPGQPLIGTVGRIHPRKDLDTFVRAAAIVAAQRPDARFAIVGSSKVKVEHDYERHIGDLIRSLGLESRVNMAGARRDIAAVMRAFDVYVNTSHHEGFGRVIAEAMAASCPVVVGDSGAPPELVENGRYGLVARPSDPADFAAQILRLLSSPAEMSAFAARSLERAQLFDVRRVAARVLDRYQEIVTRAGRPSATTAPAR
jgi:glycosyltransferase involved in cell wall biosynthesis